MRPETKIKLLRFRIRVVYALRWLVSAVVVELLAVFISSPFVLVYLCVLNTLNRQANLFNGNYFLYWLCASLILFVPMFIAVIVDTAKKRKASKDKTEPQSEQQK